MTSDEWRVARSRRRGRGVKAAPSSSSENLLEDPLSLEELHASHERFLRALDAEPNVRDLLGGVASLPSALGSPLDLLCLGLGSPSRSRTSRIQLALLHTVMSSCPRLSAQRVSLYDPAFTPSDRAFLCSLFGPTAVAGANLEGCIRCGCPALIFLPHCPLPLLNNLLFANWSPSGMSRLCLLGNRLSEALEAAAASGSDLSAVAFVQAAARMAEEVVLAWDGLLAAPMACTSLQWFPHLPPADSPLWELKSASPPDYSAADVGELVRAVPVMS